MQSDTSYTTDGRVIRGRLQRAGISVQRVACEHSAARGLAWLTVFLRDAADLQRAHDLISTMTLPDSIATVADDRPRILAHWRC